MKLSEFVNRELEKYDALREVVTDPSYNRTAQRADDKIGILLEALDGMGLQVIEDEEPPSPPAEPPPPASAGIAFGDAQAMWPRLMARLRSLTDPHALRATDSSLLVELVGGFEAVGVSIHRELGRLSGKADSFKARLDEVAAAAYNWRPGDRHGYNAQCLTEDIRHRHAELRQARGELFTLRRGHRIEIDLLKEELDRAKNPVTTANDFRRAQFEWLTEKASAIGIMEGEPWKQRDRAGIFKIKTITRDDFAGAWVTMEGDKGTWSINGFLDGWERAPEPTFGTVKS